MRLSFGVADEGGFSKNCPERGRKVLGKVIR
jgi:hypothetical protein